MSEQSLNITLPFLTGAIKLLNRQYPDRVLAEPFNEFAKALSEAERLYKSLPAEPKKRRAAKDQTLPFSDPVDRH